MFLISVKELVWLDVELLDICCVENGIGGVSIVGDIFDGFDVKLVVIVGLFFEIGVVVEW